MTYEPPLNWGAPQQPQDGYGWQAPEPPTLPPPSKPPNRAPLIAGVVIVSLAAAIGVGVLLTGNNTSSGHAAASNSAPQSQDSAGDSVSNSDSTSNNDSTSASDYPLAVSGELYLMIGSSPEFPNFAPVTGTAGTRCTASAGYNDVSEGTEVVISDDGNSTLTITTLDAGVLGSSTSSGTIDACEFSFTATVPTVDFYGIQISHRGIVKFTQAEISSAELTLGS